MHLTSKFEETKKKKEVKELKLIMNNYKVRLQISTREAWGPICFSLGLQSTEATAGKIVRVWLVNFARMI